MLKAITSPLSTVVERSSEAEKAWVGSSDSVDGVQGALSVIETAAQVVDTALEVPAGPFTAELLPKSGIETTMPPTVDDARLPSLYSLEKEDTAEHP